LDAGFAPYLVRIARLSTDLPTIKRISGHKTLIMVERYAHQNGAHISGNRPVLAV